MGKRGPVNKNAWNDSKCEGQQLPIAPIELLPDARIEWDRIVPELEKAGRLASVDLGVLATYCQAWARWLDAERFLKEHGLTYVIRDKDGRTKFVAQFPQVNIASKAAAQIKGLAADLGMSPSGRARMHDGQAKNLPQKRNTNANSGNGIDIAAKYGF